MPRTHTKSHWDILEWLHVQTLAAIMRAHAWRPDELAFQGGTALHLGHGSPRRSEDLDFLLGWNRNPDDFMTSVFRSVTSAALQAHQAKAELKTGREDRNPRTYTIKLTVPGHQRKVALKCKFWRTLQGLIECYKKQPRAIATPPGVLITPFTAPVGELEEIYLDKMHALVSSPYPKVRDLFDIWWMRTQSPLRSMIHTDAADRIEYHLKMYPGAPDTPEGFARALRSEGIQRFETLSDEEIARDLQRWLPSSLDAFRTPEAIQQMRALLKTECELLAQALESISSNAAPLPSLADDYAPL